MSTVPPCPTCGKPHVTRHGHPACAGHVKATNSERAAERGVKPGDPCRKDPIKGSTTCKVHGSGATQVRAKAKQRVAEQQARHDVELFAGRRDIHPADALLELVQWTAGEADYWRARVRQIETDDLTWGVTKVKDGGDDRGTTSEAKPHIAYVMLREASDRLEKYATAALKAGVEERRVRLAEQQGALVADVIRAILTDLNLSMTQQAKVGEIVPRHLRALTGGAA